MKAFTNLVWGYLFKGLAALNIAVPADGWFCCAYQKYAVGKNGGKVKLSKGKRPLLFLFAVYLFLLI